MNIHVPTSRIATTQAADGLPRRKWTIDDVERMVAAGIIDEGERFELIGGEIVPMSPKGIFHETVKKELNKHLVRALPPTGDILQETTLRIAPHEFREPDFIVWPRWVGLTDLRPAHLLLVVEIADSSLEYDLGRKAAYYASIGIAEYWVIAARGLVTHVHRTPGPDGYATVTAHAGTELLVPALVPELAVRLADLGLAPAAPADEGEDGAQAG